MNYLVPRLRAVAHVLRRQLCRDLQNCAVVRGAAQGVVAGVHQGHLTSDLSNQTWEKDRKRWEKSGKRLEKDGEKMDICMENMQKHGEYITKRNAIHGDFIRFQWVKHDGLWWDDMRWNGVSRARSNSWYSMIFSMIMLMWSMDRSISMSMSASEVVWYVVLLLNRGSTG